MRSHNTAIPLYNVLILQIVKRNEHVEKTMHLYAYFYKEGLKGNFLLDGEGVMMQRIP